MTTPFYAAIERVSAYIAARTGAQGLDPEILHGFNDHDLRMSDLRALLLAARRYDAEMRR